MKKWIALLLSVLLLLTMAACGGEPKVEEEEEEKDPNIGKYYGISCETDGVLMPIEAVYPGDNYLRLKEEGEAVLVLDDEKINGEWSLKGKKLTLELDDEEYAGTLKKGIITLELEDGDLILTFATKDADITKPTMPELEGLEPGRYSLCAMDQNGEYYDKSDLALAGADKSTYIIVYKDWKMDVVMDDEVFPCTYNEEYVIDEGGYETAYALVDGILEFYLSDSMTFYYVKDDASDDPAGPDTPAGTDIPAVSATAFPKDVAEKYYGDWHGWCQITNATGIYASDLNTEFDVLARYAFDKDGNCTPWMATYSAPEDNFQNLALRYDDIYGFVYVSGKLFGMEIDPTSMMYDYDGSLCLTLYLKDNDGTVDIVACLRHPDAEWDEYDFPAMPAEYQQYYKGMSFDDLVKLFEQDPATLPPLN